MSPIQQLLAIEEVKTLKARYCRLLDAHDWEGFRALLADDCVFGPSDPDAAQAERRWTGPVSADFWVTPRIEGADAIVEFISGALGSSSVHQALMPEIEIVSATEARAIWAMHGIGRGTGRYMRAYGFYRERYVCRDGRWLIQSFELLRTSLDTHEVGTAIGPVV